jgi:hypothetical protein
LADNGSYELSNLNRQDAFVEHIGLNKAVHHESQLKKVNPFVDVRSYPEGLTPFNVRELVEWCDVVVDAVDVTSSDAIQMKLALHECAKDLRKPTFSPLDVGYRQWGISFDYRSHSVQAARGRLREARQCQSPMKILFTLFPLSSVPNHCLPLIRDLLEKGDTPASQLGSAADLLSAVIVPSLVRYVETGEVVAGWNLDLSPLAFRWRTRIAWVWRGVFLRTKVRKLLRQLK